MAKKKALKKNFVRETTETLVIAIVAALLIRALFVQAFRIPTGSMENTLLVGDFLLVNKFEYGIKIPFTKWRLPSFEEPKPGDVIVFKYPLDPSLDYIKRCIAIGGQTIEIKDKKVFIDDKPFEDPEHLQFIDQRVLSKGVPEDNIFPPGSNFNRDNFGPYTIPEDHLFMMGDNRDNSLDSRYWGLLPRENVVGSAMIIYWSWDHNIPLYKFFTKVRWSRLVNIIR